MVASAVSMLHRTPSYLRRCPPRAHHRQTPRAGLAGLAAFGAPNVALGNEADGAPKQGARVRHRRVAHPLRSPALASAAILRLRKGLQLDTQQMRVHGQVRGQEAPGGRRPPCGTVGRPPAAMRCIGVRRGKRKASSRNVAPQRSGKGQDGHHAALNDRGEQGGAQGRAVGSGRAGALAPAARPSTRRPSTTGKPESFVRGGGERKTDPAKARSRQGAFATVVESESPHAAGAVAQQRAASGRNVNSPNQALPLSVGPLLDPICGSDAPQPAQRDSPRRQ